MKSDLAEPAGPVEPGFQSRTWRLAVGLCLAVWLVLHGIEATRANVNWDEYALLSRAVKTLRTGEVAGGGRPGLATVVLCAVVPWFDNEVAAVNAARLLWILPTVLMVLGVYWLVRKLMDPDAGLMAAFLLVSLPPFTRWSLQVRTDQIAMACGLGSIVLLLPLSRLNLTRAVLAGFLMGTGWLATQKVAYCAGLLIVLVLCQMALVEKLSVKGLLKASLGFAAGGIASVASFHLLVKTIGWTPAAAYRFDQGLSVFEYYQKSFGWSFYLNLVPSLAPHLVLYFVALIAVFVQLVKNPRSPIAVRCLVLLAYAGLVTYVHKAAFPYFFIVIGPLYILPLTFGFSLLLRTSSWGRKGILFTILATGIYVSIPEHRALLADTQRIQREVAEFARQATQSGQVGFQCESALFYGPGDFGTYFSQQILRFVTAKGPKGAEEFLTNLEKQQVRYVVLSHRLMEFPPTVLQYIRDRYHLIHGRILVLGVHFENHWTARRATFVTTASGTYRLHVLGPSSDAIDIDGRPLLAGGTIHLDRGEHSYAAARLPFGAVLAWDLPPVPANARPQAETFYSFDQIAAFSGTASAIRAKAVESWFNFRRHGDAH